MAVGSDRPAQRVERLVEAVPNLQFAAVVSIAAGVVLGAAEILVLDWDPEDMVGGTLIGMSVFGTITYLTDMAVLVPHGRPQDAPVGIDVKRRTFDLSTGLGLAALAILSVPLSLASDWLSAGAVFVPGVPFGNGAAALLALTRIAAWERANGRRILFDPDSKDQRPYAGAPL